MPVVSTKRFSSGSFQKTLNIEETVIPTWLSKDELIRLCGSIQKACNNFVRYNVADDCKVTLTGPGAGWMKAQLSHIEDNKSVFTVKGVNKTVLAEMLNKISLHLPERSYIFSVFDEVEEVPFDWDVTFVSFGEVDPVRLLKKALSLNLLRTSWPIVAYLTTQSDVEQWTILSNGPDSTLVLPWGQSDSQEHSAMRSIRNGLDHQKKVSLTDVVSDAWNKEQLIDLCKDIAQTVKGVSYRIKAYTKDGTDETSCVLLGVPEQVDAFKEELLKEFEDDGEGSDVESAAEERE